MVLPVAAVSGGPDLAVCIQSCSGQGTNLRSCVDEKLTTASLIPYEEEAMVIAGRRGLYRRRACSFPCHVQGFRH